MIWVTRLNGSEVVLNADLVETVESTPDTVITLVDGKKYVVAETAAEIVERVQRFRSSILTLADQPLPLAPQPGASSARDLTESNLYVLPGTRDHDGED